MTLPLSSNLFSLSFLFFLLIFLSLSAYPFRSCVFLRFNYTFHDGQRSNDIRKDKSVVSLPQHLIPFDIARPLTIQLLPILWNRLLPPP